MAAGSDEGRERCVFRARYPWSSRAAYREFSGPSRLRAEPKRCRRYEG